MQGINVKQMTYRERFLAHMHFKSVDRIPLWEWGPWPSTVLRWHKEAPPGEKPDYRKETDRYTQICCDNMGLDLWMLPRFKSYLIREDDESVTRMTDKGVVERVFRDPARTSMPEHLEYPVKTKADWEALKKRYDPNHPGRLSPLWRFYPRL